VKGSTAGRLHALIAGCALITTLVAAMPARAADDPWAANSQWGSVRLGYAKSGASQAADGAIGWGFSFSRFINPGLAWTAAVQHDLLGKYAGAAEIEVPITVEFTKHLAWSPSTRPYLGLGWGAIFHKYYRTGFDESGFRQGLFVNLGANGMIDKSSLLGFDVRLMIEQDTRSTNPTFPNKEPSSAVWSAKVTYSRIL
jgi:hypothetical protein